ncbi:hypothetical protein CLOM_g6657 [Closterium sp. NIES-68]|nr:hypothetical protein CLOM_g6657 [Closterium sp. NIES-68]GJP85611.1 hypothetical protein CLOP_g15715 [Closterium sp. NIES-67]
MLSGARPTCFLPGKAAASCATGKSMGVKSAEFELRAFKVTSLKVLWFRLAVMNLLRFLRHEMTSQARN